MINDVLWCILGCYWQYLLSRKFSSFDVGKVYFGSFLDVPPPQKFLSFGMKQTHSGAILGVVSCAFSPENFKVSNAKMVHFGAFLGIICCVSSSENV